MEMSGFRPELHVAQQSRRDKLRVPQQSSTPSHHLEDFPDNLEQIPVVHSRLNPDLVQVRNVDNANLLYDPAVYSSDMIHFSSKSNVRQAIDATDPFANSSHAHPISSNFNSLPKAPGEPRNWKSHGGSQQGCDWAVNYASGSVGSESNVVPSPVFFGEVNNISGYPHYSKPSHFNEFQDVRSSFKNPSSTQDRQKHFTSSSPLYQNSLQDVVTSASNRTQGLEMVSLVQHNLRGTGRAWPEGGNELALLPAYGNQSDVLCFENAGAWPNRPVENWSGGELGFAARKSSDEELRNVVNTDSNPQGLSLSLSSNPTSKLPQFGEGSCGSGPKPSIISKGSGKSLQDIVGVSTTNTYRNTGPLGPFTGYATILKSSKFLRPAQLLLDEFCGIKSGLKLLKPCEVSERMSSEVSTSGDAMNATETEVGAMGNNSGGSSSTFYSSNEISGDGGVGSSSCESFRPDYQQKKAKLLYMQEEVCRRYKQYHQQMQMVVSSFETVAGLSSATPYISLALKSVSRHFRSLKNAISDQLKRIRRTLGEDLSSPTTGTSSSKVDTSTSRLKYLDQSLQRHKYGGGNVGFLETQHVWRPQRGLPERSVAILRAWLFEHFLHPYPTDTDKHMLATQTGLSRNQVSNWFINARVRVWKPMVEEIHMLETKGVAEANQNSNKNCGNSAAEGSRDQLPNNLSINAMHNKQMECLGMESSLSTGHGLDAEQWNQEKRSRIDCQIPTNMDGSSLMGFVPYQRGGLEIGGLGVGAVSLTLGLRHGAENAQHQHQHQHQHQQQLQQQEDQLRQQFGGQMIHDFVG